jgi:hypothetical protein
VRVFTGNLRELYIWEKETTDHGGGMDRSKVDRENTQ